MNVGAYTQFEIIFCSHLAAYSRNSFKLTSTDILILMIINILLLLMIPWHSVVWLSYYCQTFCYKWASLSQDFDLFILLLLFLNDTEHKKNFLDKSLSILVFMFLWSSGFKFFVYNLIVDLTFLIWYSM